MPDVPITNEEVAALCEAADRITTVDGAGMEYMITRFSDWGNGIVSYSTFGGGKTFVVDHAKPDAVVGVRNGHRLHLAGQGELRLYKEFNP